MARVVLLTFMDNDAAEAFIRGVLNIQDYAYRAHPEVPLAVHQDNLEELGAIVAAHSKASALIARPTQYCKCPGRPKGWKRSPRFGWYVCPKCSKPHRTVVANFIQNHLAGCNNLLPALLEKLQPPEEASGAILEDSTSSPEHREVLAEAAQEAPGQSPEEPARA